MSGCTKKVRQEKERKVLSLINEGCSQNHIFKATGVARGTIKRIKVRNKIEVPVACKNKMIGNSNCISEKRRGIKGRCNICGAMVYMPCMACELRKDMKKEKNATNS